MRILVQKFGGSSVATPALRSQVAEKVVRARADGYAQLVVVSAMGRAGDPYATDTLLGLALATGADTTARELDLIASCGEIISAVVLAGTLRQKGVDCLALTGGQAGIITDSNFTSAQIIRVNPEPVLRHLREGRIAVVAGFQGKTEEGEVTTIGRGGSDTTAVALGAAVGAEVVEIYTDVDGIKTADPRLVPEAKTLELITYSEIFQMANQGAKVVHPQAVEIAMRRNLPLRVRSTFSDSPGTLIASGMPGGWPGFQVGKIITAVTHIADVARVKVSTPEDDVSLELRIFEELARGNISVDLINVSPSEKSFIIKDSDVARAMLILDRLGLKYEVYPDCAKVSVVGAGMRGVPGVMARVVRALHDAGVRILQTADSHLTISCLVRGGDVGRAVRALHHQFGMTDKSQ